MVPQVFMLATFLYPELFMPIQMKQKRVESGP